MSSIMNKETRNSKTLKSFVEYCESHTNERFFQALRNWIGWPFVYLSDHLINEKGTEDTFYFE